MSSSPVKIRTFDEEACIGTLWTVKATFRRSCTEMHLLNYIPKAADEFTDQQGAMVNVTEAQVKIKASLCIT